MGSFAITRPDGSVYDVDADSHEEAISKLQDHLQGEANTQAQSEFKDAPAWIKPFMAADDVARVGANAATLGFADKAIGALTGNDEAMRTAAVRSRMGGAQIPADIMGSLALPTGVPGAVAKIGGGGLVRGATGLLAGAGEGAVQGGVQAYNQDKPVIEGALPGAIGGGVGQTIASAVKGITNPIAKWWTGASDALPPPSVLNAAGKGSQPIKRVESASARAEQRGGSASAYKDEFGNISTSGKTFPPDIKEGIDRVVRGDPGTKAAQITSNIANKAAFAAPAIGFSSPPMALASTLGLPVAGAAAKFAAGQGTKQAVEDLRRQLLSKPKFQGPISNAAASRISRASRGAFRSFVDDQDD